MNLFFDCEFTGLRKDTTLISLGIVAENGKKFYAEFTDFNWRYVDEWIQKNVLDNFILEKFYPRGTIGSLDEQVEEWKQKGYEVSNFPTMNTECLLFETKRTKDDFTEVVGDCDWIRKALLEWVSQFDSIQFVSDVCHYDFVLLIDLLTGGGTALDLPNHISAVCHDINFDIAKHYRISDKEAFDFSREEIMYDVCMGCNYVKGIKHNALYDAEVIKAIWEEINAGL